jgi:hypothetical protein
MIGARCWVLSSRRCLDLESLMGDAFTLSDPAGFTWMLESPGTGAGRRNIISRLGREISNLATALRLWQAPSSGARSISRESMPADARSTRSASGFGRRRS